MDFKQLAYFVEVAECGTFSAAARKTYVSQSTLSKAIKALGDNLGVRLFYTENNRTLLTKEGQLLYGQAKKILQEYEVTLHMLEQAKQQVGGTIRVVTTFQRENLKWLTQLITDFSRQNESVVVNLSVKSPGDARRDLETGAADIGALVANEPIGEEYDALVLNQGNYQLLLNRENPFASQSSVSFGDLRDQTFLCYPPGFSIYSALIDGCKKHGFEPVIRITSSQANVLFAGVEQNLGVTVVATPPTAQEVSDQVVCLPIREPDFTFATVAIKRKDAYLQSAANRFWTFMKEHICLDP